MARCTKRGSRRPLTRDDLLIGDSFSLVDRPGSDRYMETTTGPICIRGRDAGRSWCITNSEPVFRVYRGTDVVDGRSRKVVDPPDTPTYTLEMDAKEYDALRTLLALRSNTRTASVRRAIQHPVLEEN